MKLPCTLIFFTFLFSEVVLPASAQYNWKLAKEKDGIRIYESSNEKSGFKSIKVECTTHGTFDKFVLLLQNVAGYTDWVYQTKTAYVLKKISANEFYYYSETSLPWPLSNRDAIMHVKIERDRVNRFLKVNTTSEPHYIPEKSGIVRSPYTFISWYITMPSAHTISITYTFEVNPGGNLPAWLVNMFADKGPYETFKKLKILLEK